jgi:hypothetical protein
MNFKLVNVSSKSCNVARPIQVHRTNRSQLKWCMPDKTAALSCSIHGNYDLTQLV